MRKLKSVMVAAACASMCLGSFSTVYADTIDMETESVSSLSEEDAGDIENDETIEQENEIIDSSVVDEETIESSSESEDEITEPELSEEQISIEDEETTETAASTINVTGIFGCYVEDNNGTDINGWYSDDDACYYMFLTRACTISDIVLNIDGVIISETSNGTIDTETNSISGAFTSSGDSISVTDDSGNQYKVVVMQSNIPSLSITLNGTDIDTVNSNGKDVKYTGNSVVITDTDGSVNLSQENVELKGRGNTTWILSDKKGYQLKFEKKQKVLGMSKAKKWVLLANAFDDSLMRNSLGRKLADRLGMTFSADFEYVDLWVNGEYRGNYIIGEKNEISGNRLELSDNEGILCEYDSVFYGAEDIWFKTENSGEYFAVKETVSDNTEDINAGANSFKKTYNDFVKYICNTDRSAITIDELSRYVDVESVTQYYLVTEYMTNFESYSTSFYMHKDGENDVIHFGPVWDFDSSQGTFDTEYYAYDNLVYRSLLQTPAFSEYVKNYYAQNKSAFSEIQNDISSLKAYVSSSADMNYTRWKWLGKTNQKDSSRIFASTYNQAVQNLANWHSWRLSAFNSGTTERKLYIENNRLVCDITDKGYSNISVAIWRNSDMSDLKWISTSRSGQSWIGSISLGDLAYAGTYNVHIYNFDSNGNGSFVAGMTDYIDQTATADIYAEQTSDSQMTLRAEKASSCSKVSFAVWSDENGQDDLKWYAATKSGNSTWKADIDLKNHFDSGNYNIHAYCGDMFLGAVNCQVSLQTPEVTANKKEDSNNVTVDIKNTANFDAVKVAVWGDENGQNDLKWYDADKTSDGEWQAAVFADDHKELGNYNLHVYGVKGSTMKFLGADNFQVSELEETGIKCALSESNRVLKLTAYGNMGSWDSIQVAIWGNANGQNDLKWYDMSKRSKKIDIASHSENGTYNVHLYGVKNGKYYFITADTFEVNIKASDVKAEKDDTSINVSISNADDYTDVKAAVWCSYNGQDDLVWYSTKADEGVWNCSADLNDHKGSGTILVHVYGVKNGVNTFIGSTEIAA